MSKKIKKNPVIDIDITFLFIGMIAGYFATFDLIGLIAGAFFGMVFGELYKEVKHNGKK